MSCPLIDAVERKQFFSHVANINKFRYYNHRTNDGLYLIEVGRETKNKTILTDGFFYEPSIDGVITFDEKHETSITEYKEVIYKYGWNQAGIRKTIEAIQANERAGFLTFMVCVEIWV